MLVTGYCAEAYHDLASGRSELLLVHNPDYRETGSLHSLCLAADAFDDDFLLLESDLIYESRALRTALDAPTPDALLLSGFTQSADEVFVETDAAGNLVNMSKDRSVLGDNVTGELVGITKVSTTLLNVMLATSEPRS